MSFQKDFQDYPLRIVEMDDFLLNSDDLLHNKQRPEENTQFCNTNINNKEPNGFSNESKLTFLFIDSEKYRQHFEKTHLKLKNNIVVLDRYINFQTYEELNQFYQMMKNSKRWLLHGTMKTQEIEAKDMKRKSNSIVDKYSVDKNTELLLILNSDDEYVRPILENGFSKLINSFSNSVRATFEINFENIIKSYWLNKFQSVEPFFKLEEIKASLRPVRFNVMFTAYSSMQNNRNQAEIIDLMNQEKTFTKLGNILSRIKNVISNKQKTQRSIADVSNRQNVHTEFSLDLLPSIFYYLSDNKLNLNYVSFNDDHYDRTRQFRSRDESSSKRFINKENLNKLIKNSNNHDLANRFQTYVVRSKSKFQNYNKISQADESESSNESMIQTESKEESFCSSTESKLSDLSIEPDTTPKVSDSSSTVNSSISSLSSTISNYINKKKKLNKSTSFNHLFIKNEKLIGEINNEQKLNSNESHVATFNSEDFNYDYKTRHQVKNDEMEESNRKAFVLDEKITRHPALVKQNLKSKSYDIFETFNTEKSFSKSSEEKNFSKPKYRKNSKLANVYRPINNEECEVKSISSNSNTSNNSLNDPNRLKVATVNNYKMRKMSTHKSLTRSVAYAKCRSKSPPPPISLSPNGLLAPPPVPPNSSIPSIVSSKVPLFKKSSQAYAKPILKERSIMNSNNDTAPSALYPHSRIGNVPSTQNENEFYSNNNNKSHNINLIDLQNYNHLYVKKINSENNNSRNGMAYKNKIHSSNFGQSHELSLNSLNSKQKTLESNYRFRINNYNHLDYNNVEKLF